MLIDLQPFLTIKRQRIRLDLGAVPPPGPIKERYPCIRNTHTERMYAHVQQLSCLLFLATYTVCVIRSAFAYRRCTSIRGFLSSTRSLSPSVPSNSPTYAPVFMSVFGSHMHWHVCAKYVCVYYIYVCIYAYGNSPPSLEICK